MAGTTALYLRISLDDEKQDESDSIQNQRDLLRSYVAADTELSANGVLEFADDGWSGTNFDRPQLQELLGLARQGAVRCIIVKDLSRWGRNYPEVNNYLDRIFPFLGIRFISINDHYDSNDHQGRTAPIDVAFSSIMHNIYSKELSVKIRQSYTIKANKGEYVCGQTPFGYVRSQTQRNLLVIDEEAATTVRRIFAMATEGLSCVKIAAALNEGRVDTARAWRKRNGCTNLDTSQSEANRTYWASAQVLRIIRDERYTGTLICFKFVRKTLGSRKQIKQPESEWLRVPNTHEPIVTAEQFAQANAQLRHNKKQTTRGIQPNRSPFTGKIICGCCNRAMRQQNGLHSYHYCIGEKLKKGKGCFEGKIPYALLQEVVLTAVQTEAHKAFDAHQQRKQAITQEVSDRETAIIERKRLLSQITLLERRGIQLYEDYADGKRGREEYLAAKATCSEERSSIEARVNDLTVRLEQSMGADPVRDDEPILLRVLEATEVTTEVLSLVECITVYNLERIEIQFAFADGNMAAGGTSDGA